MIGHIIVAVVYILISCTAANGQLYALPLIGHPPLFGPLIPNVYGPGIWSDNIGKPFYWRGSGLMPIPDPTIHPQWQYGGPISPFGDQFGRPVRPWDDHGTSILQQENYGYGQPW